MPGTDARTCSADRASAGGDRPSSAPRRRARRRAGCVSICTATRCGAAIRRRRPTSLPSPSRSRASTCCASPITTRSPVPSNFATSLPCRVIVGEELRTAAGEIIGLFLADRIPNGLGHLETARAIRDQGGIVYIPHPFDPMRRNLAEPALYELAGAGLIDAVEVLNAKTSLPSLNRRAAEFADGVRPRRRSGQRCPRPRRHRLGVRRDARLRDAERVPRRAPRRARSSAITGTKPAPGRRASSRRCRPPSPRIFSAMSEATPSGPFAHRSVATVSVMSETT